MDLADALWGTAPISGRHLRSLIRGLPDDARLLVALDIVHPGWGATEELLATLVEITDFGNQIFFKAHSQKDADLWEPVRIRRPGQAAPEPKRQATGAEVAAFFGGTVVEYTPQDGVNG